MVKIKQKPEDFIVEEVSSIKSKKQGAYLLFSLKKRKYTTLGALAKIAKAVGRPLKHFGFAGNKDRQAITTQICSVQGVARSRIENLDIADITVDVIGYANEPLNLGDLKGNKFTITIRDAQQDIVPGTFIVPNYYDEQRFSSHNVEIGRLILQKKFKEAAAIVASSHSKVGQALEQHPTNAIAALKVLPRNIIKIYVHTYQSWVFNELLALYIENHYQDIKKDDYSQGTLLFPLLKELPSLELPLVGFGTEFSKKWIEEKVEELLSKDDLSLRSFIIKQFPQLSSEGTLRKAFVETSLEVKEQVENKVVVEFFLPRGSYATMVIRALMS